MTDGPSVLPRPRIRPPSKTQTKNEAPDQARSLTDTRTEGGVMSTEQDTTGHLADLRPETRALIDRIQVALPGQKTPEFTRLSEHIFNIQVCTSLSDEDATVRANEMPSGTTYGWQLSTEPDHKPVPCADNPETHRHLIFEC